MATGVIIASDKFVDKFEDEDGEPRAGHVAAMIILKTDGSASEIEAGDDILNNEETLPETVER